MNKKSLTLIALAVLIIAGVGAFVYQLKTGQMNIPSPGDVLKSVGDALKGKPADIAAFADEADFKAYLAEAQAAQGDYYYGIGAGGMTRATSGIDMGMMEDVALAAPEAVFDGEETGAPSVDRVSETNVQVAGIDEPDVVKTDGQEIYYSSEQPYYWWGWEEPMPMMEKPMMDVSVGSSGSFGSSTVTPDIAPMPPIPQPQMGGTKLIKATPPEAMNLDGRIDLTGDLLLSDKTLLVITWEKINAYDVSDPANPKDVWDLKFDNSTYQSARLMDGKLYLVTSTWVNDNIPCPYFPVFIKGEAVSMPCSDIYHPTSIVPTDVTYNIMTINPKDGSLVDQVAFVGSSGNSIVYMSDKNIYVTNTFSDDTTALMIDFVLTEADDLVSSSVLQKLRTLKTYDISDQAKMVEFGVIMENFYGNMSADDRLKFDNEVQNRVEDYMDAHKRDLTKTGIVKIDAADLSVDASGEVPGYPLNQFSLDEFEGNLRLATTVGGGFWGSSFGGQTEDTNDLYVLDGNLNQIGSVLGLGDDEQIYSARFIGDRGYLVTFRQTDPFFVLDLSNPRDPKKTGELKIPGYSSYLHPLAENIILGVGQEDWQVKLSLFDVTDPTSPVEVDKYNLSDYWTDVQNTHHAFLQDEKFKVFFMPGGQGGYVFSYKDNKLSLERAVTGVAAERALYINDNLYIVGTTGIEVLDENSWESIGHLDLQ